MKISSILMILFALLLSCEHIEEGTPGDDIFYYDFEPEPYFSVIDSLIFLSYYDHCGGPCLNRVIRSPDHSYYFDVDLDGTEDFKISHYVSRSDNWTWSPCSPCDSIYGFGVQITSLRDSCGIAIIESLYYGSMGYGILRMDSTMTVDASCIYKGTSLLYANDPNWGVSLGPEGPVFLGLRIFHAEKYYYGWLHAEVSYHGFTLKEYAINLTEDRPIQVSQKTNN